MIPSRFDSQPTLNRLENASQNATLKTLSQLCRALRCGVGDLFETGPVRLRQGGARRQKR
jgi:transcriptional regulator with XRE-family HTH domain